MRRERASFLAACLALLLGGLGALASPAWADGPPVAPPPVAPAPAAPAPAPAPATGDAKPAEEGTRREISMKDLEKRIFARPLAGVTMIVVKFGTALAGLVVVFLAWSRRRDVRLGLAPPLPPSSPPPQAVALAPALALLALAMMGGGLLQLALTGLPSGGWSPKKDPIGAGIGSTAVFTVGVAVFAVAAIRRQRRAQGLTPWAAGPASRAAVVTFAVSATLVLVLSLFATWAIQQFLGREPMAQDLIGHVLDPIHPKDPWLIAVFGVLVAPVTEECLFRGLLYPALRGWVGRGWGAVVASALFAGVHVDLAAALPLFGLAMLLTMLYERTGSLLAASLMHALNNATSLLPLFLLR